MRQILNDVYCPIRDLLEIIQGDCATKKKLIMNSGRLTEKGLKIVKAMEKATGFSLIR